MMVVASLAVASTLLSQESKQYWSERRHTHEKVTGIQGVLTRFQRAHHRLPCPAPAHLPRTDPLYGVEAYGCSEGGAQDGIVRAMAGDIAVRIGALPVRTLGLSDVEGEDSWLSKLRYAVTEDTTDPFRFSDAAGALTIIDPHGAVVTEHASFAVISHGSNRIGAISAKTGLAVRPCADAGEAERENCDNDTVFRLGDFEGGNVSGYDDSVSYGMSDAIAKNLNRPCTVPFTPSPFTWGEGCSAGFSPALDGSVQALTSTVADSVGTAEVRCNNGMLEIVTSACEVYERCPLPWGGSIGHGEHITAYQESVAPCDGTCRSQIRTCNDGVLSGTYSSQGCTMPKCWERIGISLGIAALFCWQTSPHGKPCENQGQWCVGNDRLCEHCLPMLFFFQCRQQ